MTNYCDDYRVEPIGLENIDMGDRARKDYKDIAKLARRIEDKGLLNPITIYQKPETYDGEPPFLLMAGGRRYRAHEVLKYPEIMCHIYDRELNELEIKSIELMENVDREELEYHEQIKLEQEIHNLMIQIHGKKTSTKPDADGHSLADTARMLNKDPSTMSNDMRIAKAMEDFPDLQWNKMKNKQEALKVVKKIGSSIGRMEKAKKAEKELGTGDARKKTIYDSFIIGDFFDLIEKMPSNYFNLVEIDPPYAIDLQKKKKGYNYEGYNEIPFKEYGDFISRVLKSCYDKMADNSWLILWFGPDPWFDFMAHSLRECRFSTTGLVGLWVKGAEEEGIVESAGGQTHMPNSRLANAYEMFYYAWKGNPTLASPGQSNVFGYKPVPPGQKTHPTERPLGLISDILTTFTIEGSRILVPFAGSGTTLVSAYQNKMTAIGFDLTEAYKDGYILRVNEMF